jgi:ectoine hydroxylase-related dioxygenase (phytanoyl-CoA dioxygenase family)
MITETTSGMTAAEAESFLKDGYCVADGVLSAEHMDRLRRACDEVLAAQKTPRVSMLPLLRHPEFLALIEHPAILERNRAIFGRQTQLISLDLHSQAPGNSEPERAWHRDLSFPGDTPVIATTIVVTDDVTMDMGPTRVVPGTHRGRATPPRDRWNEPLPGEVPVALKAGQGLFFNGAIWHSAGRNVSAQTRKVIILGYGYWWLRRYRGQSDLPHQDLPWEALAGASEERLVLLGLRQPERAFHYYEPTYLGDG